MERRQNGEEAGICEMRSEEPEVSTSFLPLRQSVDCAPRPERRNRSFKT